MKNPLIHPFKFRTATIEDVNNIVELVQSAYRGESSRSGWTTEADLLEGTRTDTQEVSDIIKSPDNIILLYENDHQFIASVHIQQQKTTGYLGMLAVLPSMQNNGIGKELLSTAENMAQQLWQCRRMQMSVITLRTELIAWYERCGYHRTGIHKLFPYGQARYGFPQRDDLLLEILEKRL